MSRFGRYCLLGVVWLAAVCRWPGLFANTFHADEALFAFWARLIAVWRDPLLLAQAVDKPPLLFYGQALFYPLLGPVEWAARWPNLIASLLLVPLIGLLAWRIYGDEWVAIAAALVVALSPLSIQFSATAFTDPLLTTLLMASLVVASNKSQVTSCKLRVASGPVALPIEYAHTRTRAHAHTYSGLFFGLAVATKHQAWLFLPLLVGVALLAGWRQREWQRWLAGFVPVLLLLFLWEMARTDGPALWPMQLANFGGIRLIWSWEVQSRLVAWLGQGQYVVALPLLVAGIPVAAVSGFRCWRMSSRAAAFDLLFALYLFTYGLLHWLLAVPVWDRYLLPVAPIVALLLSRGFKQLLERLVKQDGPAAIKTTTKHTLALIVLLVLQIPNAWQARSGRFGIGGQPSADGGAAQVAEALAGEPYGTVLYDHWYSWQWRYHFFDRRVYVSWFPHPAALAEDLAVFGRAGNPRYLALPNEPVALPVRRAVTESGFRLEPVAIDSQDGINLYQILPVTR